MQPSDDERLRHMLDAAREAVQLLGGRSEEEVRKDRALTLAFVKLIEIVGEAAVHVSPQRQAAITGIPWRDVMSTRNRLIHGYYDVDVAIVVKTVAEDFPPLMQALERSLAST